MKKMLILLTVFAAALVFVSPALAVDNEATPGASFTVNDGNATPAFLTFNFSPAVVGQYFSDGTADTNQQWYALCTYHGGGTKFYGATSTDTTIYKKDRETDMTLADAGIPTSQEVEDNGYNTDAEGNPVTDPETGEVIAAGWDAGWYK